MGQLTWTLGDPDLDLLGRVGLGAMAGLIFAAEEEGHSFGPLRAKVDARSITLEWDDDVTDQDALTPLVEYAWQTRNASAGGLGIFYFPAVHASSKDDFVARLAEHSGVLSTFLQHPRVQPKTKPVTAEVHLDEERVVPVRFVEPTGAVAYVKGFTSDLFKRKKLISGEVGFSSYLRPGATSRHAGEESWQGSIHEAIPLMFAPTACFYFHVHGSDWVVVAPDVTDLELFAMLRQDLRFDPRAREVASASDAGLRVLTTLRARALNVLRKEGATSGACMVLRVGGVAWNRQNVRNRALVLRPDEVSLRAFEKLDARLANALVARKDGSGVFVKVPSPRALLAENLVDRAYWYRGLFDVPREQREDVEKNRKQGESAQRVWFRWIRRYRKELSELMADLEQLGVDGATGIDVIFRAAFHETLRRLYGREVDQAKRGSRDVRERLADRTEKIRRDLTKAQTSHHVRSVLAELFAEAGRTSSLQQHADAIWRFIDHPEEWRRARDLALFSLATYASTRTSEADEIEADDDMDDMDAAHDDAKNDEGVE